jgi:hypothetical protein
MAARQLGYLTVLKVGADGQPAAAVLVGRDRLVDVDLAAGDATPRVRPEGKLPTDLVPWLDDQGKVVILPQELLLKNQILGELLARIDRRTAGLGLNAVPTLWLHILLGPTAADLDAASRYVYRPPFDRLRDEINRILEKHRLENESATQQP